MPEQESNSIDFLLNRVPVKILFSLKDRRTDNYLLAISRDTDTTYSHTIKTMDRMEKKGIVKYDSKGRKKIAELTGKGEEIAEQCINLVNTLKEESVTEV